MTRLPARIELSGNAHETIASENAKQLPLETGGVLLGYREGRNIVVTHALTVDGQAGTNRYVRDDVRANELLEEFLAGRADDDPTGYIGEWHSHPAPSGPSPTDVAAMRAIAKSSDGPVALLVYAPGRTDPFIGLVAQRHRLGRITSTKAEVSFPASRFAPLGPLPDGAVRGDGPVFISYRQSDGTPHAESLEGLLRAAGLVVWRDNSDLRAGTTIDRLEQALTKGLSAGVLVVTPEIVYSEIVRERELPRLLELDNDSAFSLCIANAIPRVGNGSKCDYDGPDRLLRLSPARTLADKKQSNMLAPTGEVEIVRDLLMHRVEQRRPKIREEGRPFSIRVQTRPTPFALEADEDDLHIRIKSSDNGRLPSREGLEHLKTTLPLTGDAVYASGAKTARISGGAHLSVALAIGAALPETKIGNVEVLDARDQIWTSVTPEDDPITTQLDSTRLIVAGLRQPEVPDRAAIFISLTPAPDETAFERLLHDSTQPFTTAAVISIAGSDRIDSREAGRLSAAIARQIKQLAATNGRAEVHLAFHGPYPMAILIGRYLNTLRTVVYEWETSDTSDSRYSPALILEPGIAGGPITDVLVLEEQSGC
ncbi:SAVED domain-containing protein [Glaciihabitans sp. dw_435]|uniref:SAVED domain-containing protein n=1 Tax=Glaciihabitans sp. dw_435 TaxID=2720081 RepID=UPI001BD6BC38|nr:SAVED domain-containing protein [Glaciihabitans sp. dw_435]